MRILFSFSPNGTNKFTIDFFFYNLIFEIVKISMDFICAVSRRVHKINNQCPSEIFAILATRPNTIAKPLNKCNAFNGIWFYGSI